MANQYIAIGGSSAGAAWGFRVLQWDEANLTQKFALFPTQDCYGTSWSPVANDIAVALVQTLGGEYGFYLVQVDDEGGYVADKEYFLNETCYSCAFSPNGEYVAVTHENSPYFTLLKWDGTNLTEVANYALPIRGAGVNWSPDGQYIGVAGYTSKYFYLLKWDGTNLTEVANYALPCGTFGRVFDCAFSPIGLYPDGQYIGVAFRSYAPDKDAGFFLLRCDEVNLTLASEYAIEPGEETDCFTCRFSPNGKYIAVGHARNSSFTLLKWDGKYLTLAAQYPFVDDEWIQGVSFDETGTLIGVGTDKIPYFLLLNWDGVSLTLVDNYNPGDSVWSCPFHLPPPSLVEGIRSPDTLLTEQTKNPTNVSDPKPEFSAIHRMELV